MNKALLLAGFLFTTVFPLSAQTEDLLKNPGFEDGATAWNLGKGDMATITNDAAKRGTNGLHIVDKSSEQGSGVISEKFPVKPGQKVKIEFWARTKDAKFISVHMVPFAEDKSWTTDGNEKLPGVAIDDVSGKWKKYEFEATVLENMNSVAIWIHSWSASLGTADFDDFVIKIK